MCIKTTRNKTKEKEEEGEDDEREGEAQKQKQKQRLTVNWMQTRYGERLTWRLCEPSIELKLALDHL